MSKNVTPHFRWDEFTESATAIKYGYDNTPDDFARSNIIMVSRILEQVRRRFGKPLKINSGYRSPAVNMAVGGSDNSYHLDGRAVDIEVRHFTDTEISELLVLLDQEHPIELYYSQSGYVHAAY